MTLQRATRAADGRVTGATLGYLEAWARRDPAGLERYMRTHSDRIVLRGFKAYTLHIHPRYGFGWVQQWFTGWEGTEC